MRRRETLEGIRIREGHGKGEEIRFGPRKTLGPGQYEPFPKQASIAVMKQDVLVDSKAQCPRLSKEQRSRDGG
jgi:hypothetical protein